MFKTVALSAKPYITKLEPIEGRNAEYEFEGWFPEVWFELQVRIKIIVHIWITHN